ncbi:MAG TPA: DUF4157 domain-containing protein, partial [Bryobacteraceae bacterium]|nr:DUF4157 domain-containing protein [Bryobacteraceae bacterium]
MEHSFGRSFDSVRVHTGGAADSVTREHHAEALTVGNKIAFGSGRFRPDSASGQHLIAHELAHVAQQSATGHPSAQARSIDSVPGEPAEVAAESAASQAVRGERVQVTAGDHSMHNRVMRRALRTPAPPPNPAPLRGRVKPPPTMQPSKRAALEAVADVAAARPERAKAAVEALAPKPEPQPASGEGKMKAQEQTDEARAAAKEAIEAAPAEPETGAHVPEAVGPAAGQAAPNAVQEAPSVAEADKKEE